MAKYRSMSKPLPTYYKSQVAVSEFWETIFKNLEYLNDNMGFLDNESFGSFLRKVQKFEEPLEVFNSKSEKPGKFQGGLFMELGFI